MERERFIKNEKEAISKSIIENAKIQNVFGINFIIKRDGRKVPFDFNKIKIAIIKAMAVNNVVDEKVAEDLVNHVIKKLILANKEIPTVEEIQDVVENTLIEHNLSQTAKEYILYRAERSRIRDSKTRLIKTLHDLTFKYSKDSNIKRENANIDGDTAMGTMLKYGSESAKQFYEMSVLNPLHAKLHKEGDIHIHDLDFLTLTTTCCQIDLIKLFKGGFSTGHGFLREPNHIGSYASLACIAIQSNQNDQHGGQSVPNFDYAMALGVKKTFVKHYVANLAKALELLCNKEDLSLAQRIYDQVKQNKGSIPSLTNQNKKYLQEEKKLLQNEGLDINSINKCQQFANDQAYKETNKDTYQAMEGLIHNLNTMHSRAGAQVPFSSINYGTDTSEEGRMVIRNLLLATQAGLGNGETPIFPIQIFKVKEGINYNEGEPNYDLFKLAIQTSAKRLFPNFSFIDAPFNLKYYKKNKPETEIAYMGCRTRVIGNVYDPQNEIVFGRGNLSFTSINLPRLAIKSNKNIELFFEQLDNMVDIVAKQLLERFDIQKNKKVKNYPFLMGQSVWIGSDKLKSDDTVEEVLKHGTLTVGFIGLAECLKALIGKHHGESAEAQNLGLEIIGKLRSKMDKLSEKYKLNFSVIATPAEGLSGRFVLMDRKKYGVIEGVTDRDYYTNSFHIPVYYHISAYDKIRLEAPYHALTNAGHISYVEFDGEAANNLEAFEAVIRYMKECGIGYGSINHPVDRDPICGYTGVIKKICPNCGREESDGKEHFVRIRRITGYLVGSLDNFNDGKRAEERDRVYHN